MAEKEPERIPPEEWIPEIPFDHADFMNRVAVPTYENEPEEPEQAEPEGGTPPAV